MSPTTVSSTSSPINAQTLALAKLLGAQERYRVALIELAHSQKSALRNIAIGAIHLREHWAVWLEHDLQDCYHWRNRMDFFENQALRLKRG